MEGLLWYFLGGAGAVGLSGAWTWILSHGGGLGERVVCFCVSVDL